MHKLSCLHPLILRMCSVVLRLHLHRKINPKSTDHRESNHHPLNCGALFSNIALVPSIASCVANAQTICSSANEYFFLNEPAFHCSQNAIFPLEISAAETP